MIFQKSAFTPVNFITKSNFKKNLIGFDLEDVASDFICVFSAPSISAYLLGSLCPGDRSFFRLDLGPFYSSTEDGANNQLALDDLLLTYESTFSRIATSIRIEFDGLMIKKFLLALNDKYRRANLSEQHCWKEV